METLGYSQTFQYRTLMLCIHKWLLVAQWHKLRQQVWCFSEETVDLTLPGDSTLVPDSLRITLAVVGKITKRPMPVTESYLHNVI